MYIRCIQFLSVPLSVPQSSNENASKENLESEEELDECGVFFASNDLAHIVEFLSAFVSTHSDNVALLLFDVFDRHMCNRKSHLLQELNVLSPIQFFKSTSTTYHRQF
jgi:hypothetical protein